MRRLLFQAKKKEGQDKFWGSSFFFFQSHQLSGLYTEAWDVHGGAESEGEDQKCRINGAYSMVPQLVCLVFWFV